MGPLRSDRRPRRVSEALDLVDYRRRVAAIYARVRDGDGRPAWERWRAEREELFRTHPQTPLEDPESFAGLPYYGYDPGWRTVGTLEQGERADFDVSHSGAGATAFTNLGKIRFRVKGHDGSLDALWLNSYGGGLFVPFRDATNGGDTYGGGRYLLDTVKGADLGTDGESIVLDFNYAYHPSCVHSYRWSCPLAPSGNTLDFAVTAGERLAETPDSTDT